MARKGLLGGGIALVVIGMIIVIPSVIINNIQSNNVQQCATLTGQLNQLNQDNAQICNNAPRYQSFSDAGIITGAILLVIGIPLIITGAIKEGKPKIQTY